MQHNSLSCFSHSVSYSHAVYYKHAAGIFRNSYKQDVTLYIVIFLVGCAVVCAACVARLCCGLVICIGQLSKLYIKSEKTTLLKHSDILIRQKDGNTKPCHHMYD